MVQSNRMLRRQFLVASASFLSTPFVATAARAGQAQERRLQFHNPHTGEHFDAVYFSNGRYRNDALSEFYRIARDWRQDAEVKIDTRTINVVYKIQTLLEKEGPFQLVSGYRTPQTNHLVHGAKHSFHMRGEALDIAHPEVSTRLLHKVALHVRGGGVGYYPREHFVHVDCGPVRSWTA